MCRIIAHDFEGKFNIYLSIKISKKCATLQNVDNIFKIKENIPRNAFKEIYHFLHEETLSFTYETYKYVIRLAEILQITSFFEWMDTNVTCFLIYTWKNENHIYVLTPYEYEKTITIKNIKLSSNTTSINVGEYSHQSLFFFKLFYEGREINISEYNIGNILSLADFLNCEELYEFLKNKLEKFPNNLITERSFKEIRIYPSIFYKISENYLDQTLKKKSYIKILIERNQKKKFIHNTNKYRSLYLISYFKDEIEKTKIDKNILEHSFVSRMNSFLNINKVIAKFSWEILHIENRERLINDYDIPRSRRSAFIKNKKYDDIVNYINLISN